MENNHHHYGTTKKVKDVDETNGNNKNKTIPTTNNTTMTTTTYCNQSKLPRLPIPTLEETSKRFQRTLWALQTQEQRQKTKHIIEQFILSKEGQKLQNELIQYDLNGTKSGNIGSYVEEFWSDAYLAPDCSVVLNLNPFFLLEDGPDPKHSKNQIKRAASLVFASLKFASMLRTETLTPDTFRGSPLCMDQFKSILGSCRIPCDDKDIVECDPTSSHVVVLKKNQIYYFQALWPNGTVAVNEDDIIDILCAIEQDFEDYNDDDDEDDDADENDAIIRHFHNGNKKSKNKNNGVHHHHHHHHKKKNGDVSGGLLGVDGMLSTSEKIKLKQERSKNALGVLTTLHRRSWCAARKNLIENSSHNREALGIVDSALFVLALDDFIPKNVHEAAANMLHGTYKLEMNTDDMVDYQVGSCLNRWYDKLQIIVCGDGTAGVNFEHSAIDGHTALRFSSDIFTETVVNFAQSITKSIYGKDDGRVPSVLTAPVVRASKMTTMTTTTTMNGGAGKKKKNNNKHMIGTSDNDGDAMNNQYDYCDTRPKRLDFEIPASIAKQIYHAETSLGDHIETTETRVLEFDLFGKTLITKNKMSPDSFVQMSILVAYYRLYGKLVNSYEPVLTKRYLHGRTEAMRSTTPKAAIFCETWCSQFTSINEKLASLVQATKEHSNLVKIAASGGGIDRHLFALKCIANKNKWEHIPDFFTSEPWNLLNHTILSTSNCGNPSLRHFGFGPVVHDGFGIGYIIKDNGLQYACSSKCRQTQRYINTLYKFLHQVYDYLAPNTIMEVTGYETRNSSDSGSDDDNDDTYENGKKKKKKTPLRSSSSSHHHGGNKSGSMEDATKLYYADNFDWYGESPLLSTSSGTTTTKTTAAVSSAAAAATKTSSPLQKKSPPSSTTNQKQQNVDRNGGLGARKSSYLSLVRQRSMSITKETMKKVGVVVVTPQTSFGHEEEEEEVVEDNDNDNDNGNDGSGTCQQQQQKKKK